MGCLIIVFLTAAAAFAVSKCFNYVFLMNVLNYVFLINILLQILVFFIILYHNDITTVFLFLLVAFFMGEVYLLEVQVEQTLEKWERVAKVINKRTLILSSLWMLQVDLVTRCILTGLLVVYSYNFP